ncbi:MAG: hypothetical protein IJH99_03250 [Eubacterium sp.]|nr:hypothetical protein [Eubacterium sp.]
MKQYSADRKNRKSARLAAAVFSVVCLTAATVPAAAAETPYSAGINEDQTVTVGSTADLTVTVENDGFDSFNSVDMTVTYDPEMVELKTDALEGMEFTDDAGTVRIIGYGDDKDCGDAITLSFGVKKAGRTEVVLSSAKVDESVSAINYDAPEAEISSEKAVLSINYPVELDEGLTGGDSAVPGEDYTFTADDPNYDHNITATVDGEPVQVTDNGDGSYTVKNVNGSLKVTDEKTPKTFPVTVSGDTDDLTAPEEATYGTDYEFSVKPEDGFEYKVKATINGTEVPVNGPDDNGNYRVYGEKITGPLSIEVTKSEKKPEPTPTPAPSGGGSGGKTTPGKNVPDTGDANGSAPWACLMAAAAAAAALAFQKKKKRG